MNKRPRNCWFG